LAGALLAFARALGDFGATLMVGGNIPGRTRTASLALFDAVNAGDAAEARGWTALISVVALAVLAVVQAAQGARRSSR
jgi:molybdate transport system permease protein